MSAKTVEGVRVYKNHDGTLAVFLRHGPNWNFLGSYPTAEAAGRDVVAHRDLITSEQYHDF